MLLLALPCRHCCRCAHCRVPTYPGRCRPLSRLEQNAFRCQEPLCARVRPCPAMRKGAISWAPSRGFNLPPVSKLLERQAVQLRSRPPAYRVRPAHHLTSHAGLKIGMNSRTVVAGPGLLHCGEGAPTVAIEALCRKATANDSTIVVFGPLHSPAKCKTPGSKFQLRYPIANRRCPVTLRSQT